MPSDPYGILNSAKTGKRRIDKYIPAGSPQKRAGGVELLRSIQHHIAGNGKAVDIRLMPVKHVG